MIGFFSTRSVATGTLIWGFTWFPKFMEELAARVSTPVPVVSKTTRLARFIRCVFLFGGAYHNLTLAKNKLFVNGGDN